MILISICSIFSIGESSQELFYWHFRLTLKRHLEHLPFLDEKVPTFFLSSQVLDSDLSTLILIYIIIIHREIRSAFSNLISSITYLNVCHHWVAASKHWTYFHTVKNSKLRFNNLHLFIMCYRKDKRLLTRILCCSYTSPARRTKSSKYFIKLRLNNHNSIRNIITQIMKFISREISITSSIEKFKILDFLREKLTYIFNWGNNLRIDKIGITFINLFKIFLYFGLILFNYFHIFTNEILKFGLLVRDSKELQVLYDMALIYFLKFRVLN